MNTEFLRGFIETAKTGSISRASEELHVSHTALSKQLKSLEQQLDVQLFVRSAQGVELTDAGRVLHESAMAILNELSALTHALEPHKTWRRIRVGTVPDLASQYVVSSLHKLEQQGYEVELVCRQSTKEVYKLLFDGEVELLVAERISMHPSIWMGDLHQEPLFVVMPREHTFSGREGVSLAELGSEPLVLYAEGCTIRAKLTELFAAVNQPMNIKTEVNFHEVILGYVVNGAGLTVLPEAYITQLSSDRLVSVPLNHPDAQRTIAVFSTNRPKGEKIFRLLR